MSRQTVRQRLALQSAQPPVIPAHYHHTRLSGWVVPAVVVGLILVGVLSGAVA